MSILGIDYGRRKIGIAIAEGRLAQPLRVIRVRSLKDALEKVSEVVKVLEASKVTVGVSEGKMGEESEKFSLSLRKKLSVPIETFDETLSTQEASQLSKEAQMTRKKRKALEDAFAAAVMLQRYLDSS